MSGVSFAIGAAEGGVAGLIGTELAILARREFLPLDPGYTVDGFHPSPIGYGFWADALAPSVIDELTAEG